MGGGVGPGVGGGVGGGVGPGVGGGVGGGVGPGVGGGVGPVSTQTTAKRVNIMLNTSIDITLQHISVHSLIESTQYITYDTHRYEKTYLESAAELAEE